MSSTLSHSSQDSISVSVGRIFLSLFLHRLYSASRSSFLRMYSWISSKTLRRSDAMYHHPRIEILPPAIEIRAPRIANREFSCTAAAITTQDIGTPAAMLDRHLIFVEREVWYCRR